MDPVETYELKEKVGLGSFAVVYRGTERKTKKNVAVKLVDLNFADTQIECIQGEINALLECKCPNIISYHQAILKDSMLWIVMEYMEVGTLSQLIRMRTFKEYEIGVFCREISNGLNYLHNRGWVHRDIKSANILVSSSGDVKLSDFGFSRTFTNTINKFDTFIGTPLWMAPEIIKESEYDFKVDIWSLGITCVEMALGNPPFSDMHVMKALFLIPTSDPPKLPTHHFSTQIQQFVDLCLNKNPQDRPCASLLLRHCFLKKSKKKSSILPLIEQYLSQKTKNLDLPDTDDTEVTGEPEQSCFKFDFSSHRQNMTNKDDSPTDPENIIIDIESTITNQMKAYILKNLHAQALEAKTKENGNKNEEAGNEQQEGEHTNEETPWSLEDREIESDQGNKVETQNIIEVENINVKDFLSENVSFMALKNSLKNKIPKDDHEVVNEFSDHINQCLNENINFLHEMSLKIVQKIMPKQEIRFCTNL